MSYDLMVFEISDAPKNRKEFMSWFEKQTEWAEEHSYEDHAVTSNALKSWFEEMITHFPPMNGPLASDEVDDPRVTDYCIGQSVIYSAFAWSQSDQALLKMRELSIKHSVGFFDVSANEGEILFGEKMHQIVQKKPWWKIW